jgi:DNA-binding response OmpR family regulator
VQLPIVILSVSTDVVDKVLLLELGTDDYVTKPFNPRELLARVRAVIRSTHTPIPNKDASEVYCRVRVAGPGERSASKLSIFNSPAEC